MRISDWSSDVCSSDLACAVSQLEIFIWLSSCAFWENSSITLPISGDTESIASLNAKPRALFAVAFSMAMISEELRNERLPLNRSMPTHPARALGCCGLNGWRLVRGKRHQTCPTQKH